MRPPMLHKAYLQTTSRNAYGDYASSAETELPCHFRYIAEQITTTGDEVAQGAAMAWFMPDAEVERQSILRIDDEYWRVEKVTKARRLRNPDVLFIKCELLRYGVIS